MAYLEVVSKEFLTRYDEENTCRSDAVLDRHKNCLEEIHICGMFVFVCISAILCFMQGFYPLHIVRKNVDLRACIRNFLNLSGSTYSLDSSLEGGYCSSPLHCPAASSTHSFLNLVYKHLHFKITMLVCSGQSVFDCLFGIDSFNLRKYNQAKDWHRNILQVLEIF